MKPRNLSNTKKKSYKESIKINQSIKIIFKVF